MHGIVSRPIVQTSWLSFSETMRLDGRTAVRFMAHRASGSMQLHRDAGITSIVLGRAGNLKLEVSIAATRADGRVSIPRHLTCGAKFSAQGYS
jgi:hypothetical protein